MQRYLYFQGPMPPAQPSAPSPPAAGPAASLPPPGPSGPPAHHTRTLGLALGALGVVYGDIGTSPLYAVRECFHGLHAVPLTQTNVLGVLSLIFWSLTLVISLKYVVFILRADNKGEGGMYALLALVPTDPRRTSPRLYATVALAGVFGASLLYGESIITPAISVLSAIEGLQVATAAASPLVVPLTCGILLVLFLSQQRGTGRIGGVFGPIVLVWFAAIGALGLSQVVRHPHVLLALDPARAWAFFAANGTHGAVVLGSVVLCITGGEALYADLGHFGRLPIRLSWLSVAFPALLLNYFGQGAALLARPELAPNPFYGIVPEPWLYPMVALSTMATVIASQAMISGVFSLTQQAVQLGYLPRLRIVHTSSETRGQIYVPQVNYALMVVCLALVLGFRESSRLAAAYGLSVTATMAITSMLFFVVVTRAWGWRLWKAVPLVALFLAFDLSFFGSNLLKLADGGWITLAVAGSITIAMTTWRDGRAELARKMRSVRFPIEWFVEDVERQHPHRVSGTAVFMTLSAEDTPLALLHHFKHNQVLHQNVVLLSILSTDVPAVPPAERVLVVELGQGFYRVTAAYGFMERPSAPDVLETAAHYGLHARPFTTTYFLGRESLLTSGRARMMRWRKVLFSVMSRNAFTAPAYFGIPPDRVIEMGVQLEL
ncbi:MAG: KUP/HAK/KT family potassium transporter [Candidatus Latescibacterota bacterium]